MGTNVQTPAAPVTIRSDDALIVVDVQRDFLPGGALGVAEGERIFAPIERLADRFPRVYATRDWHPANHTSFAQHGGPWPVHCVAGSQGAELDERVARKRIDRIVDKGVDRQTDGYSGFAATDLVSRSARNIVAKTGKSFEDAVQALADMNPGRRLIEPEEVAEAAARLVADDTTNGETVVLDGTAPAPKGATR